MVTYSIVWVSPNQPEVILDEYNNQYNTLEEAKLDYDILLDGHTLNDDGLDWVPRITKVTEEFI